MKSVLYLTLLILLPFITKAQVTVFDPATHNLPLPSNMSIVEIDNESYLRIISNLSGVIIPVESYFVTPKATHFNFNIKYKEGNSGISAENISLNIMFTNSYYDEIGTGSFPASLDFTQHSIEVEFGYTLNTIMVVATSGSEYPENDTIYLSKVEVEGLPNNAPFANAGSDQNVDEGTLVTLNGTASSDPDSDPLRYSWTAPQGITLSSNTAAQPTFTAPSVSSDTPYEFTLVVNDGLDYSTPDIVIITVNKRVNNAPIANAGPDQNVNEGTLVTLDGTASSDPDSDPLEYLWTAPLGITLSDNTVAQPTFTAPSVNTDTPYEFTLIVNDGTVDSEPDVVVITVHNVNHAPTANAGQDQNVDEGTLVTLSGTASSDPDSDPLEYLWTAPQGITLSSNTVAQPTFTAPSVNTDTPYEFTLIVNDGTVDSEPDVVVITVQNVESGIPATVAVDGLTLGSGFERCFGATQTIIVAENLPVVVNNNATLTLIAGQSIVFYPGFHAQPGSNVHAYITLSQTFCEAIKSQNLLATENNVAIGQQSDEIIDNHEVLNTEPSLMVYPNPNNGDFTLRLNNFTYPSRVVIVNSMGRSVYQQNTTEAHHEIRLNGMPKGIYFLNVIENGKIYSQKLLINP